MKINSNKQNLIARLKSQSETLWALSGQQATRLLVLSVTVGIGMAGVEFCFAFFLQNYFSRLGLVTVPTSFQSVLPESPLMALLALVFAGFLRFLFQSLKLYSARLAQQSFSNTQRSRIIEYHLHQAKLTSTAETLSLFNDEVQRGSLAFMNLAYFFIAAASTVVLFISLIFTESYAAILSLLFLGFLYLPTRFLNRSANRHGQELSAHWGKVNSFFIDGIRNNFYLRLYDKIESTIETSRNYLNLYLETFKKTFLVLSLKATFPAFIGLLLVAVVGYVQIVVLENGNPGSLLVFFYLFLRFSQEASSALTTLSEFMLHSHSLRHIVDWYRRLSGSPKTSFDNTKTPLENPPTPLLEETLRTLVCQEVSFSYPQSTPIFDQLSLTLKRSDCLVIMGPSGAGKSTLLSLLLGLEKPTNGKIFFNQGHSHSQFGGNFYKKVGYVGPTPFLISGTIRENLLYAHPHPQLVTDQEILAALKFVFLDVLVQGFSKGLMTRLDEEGATISSGQKQRLMFARALIRKPDLLILDEATSNLDNDLEEKILENLKSLNAELILIAVSHRDSFKRISTQNLNL